MKNSTVPLKHSLYLHSQETWMYMNTIWYINGALAQIASIANQN